MKEWNIFDLYELKTYPNPDTLVWLYCEQRSNMGEMLPCVGHYDEQDRMFYEAETGFGMTKVSHWQTLDAPKLPPLTDEACVEFYQARKQSR